MIFIVWEILLIGCQSQFPTYFSLAHLQRIGRKSQIPSSPASLAGESCHVTVLASEMGKGYFLSLTRFLIPASERTLMLEIVAVIL